MSQKAEPTNTSMDLLVLVQQKRNLDAAIALRTMHPGEALAVCAQLVLLALGQGCKQIIRRLFAHTLQLQQIILAQAVQIRSIAH